MPWSSFWYSLIPVPARFDTQHGRGLTTGDNHAIVGARHGELLGEKMFFDSRKNDRPAVLRFMSRTVTHLHTAQPFGNHWTDEGGPVSQESYASRGSVEKGCQQIGHHTCRDRPY